MSKSYGQIRDALLEMLYGVDHLGRDNVFYGDSQPLANGLDACVVVRFAGMKQERDSFGQALENWTLTLLLYTSAQEELSDIYRRSDLLRQRVLTALRAQPDLGLGQDILESWVGAVQPQSMQSRIGDVAFHCESLDLSIQQSIDDGEIA